MRVVKCTEQKYTVLIDRTTKFGNPFKDGTRAENIARFREYALNNPPLLDAIDSLSDEDLLGCWCFPKRCHGDVIIEIYNERKINKLLTST